jgi:hypothetical protein
MVHVCAACGVMRPAEDLLAFWALANPDRRRHVCRPSRPSSESRESCFAAVVGPAARVGIALAVPPAPAASSLGPVRPWTTEWDVLLASVGARAA